MTTATEPEAPEAPVTYPPDHLTDEELAIVALARQSFVAFLLYVYPESFRDDNGDPELFTNAKGERVPWSIGYVHLVWAAIVERHPRVCILAPRLHLKSTILNHAFSFWRIFRGDMPLVDVVVVSYNDKLAAGHTATIKREILSNRFCRLWKDNKRAAESVVDFRIDFGTGERWRGTVVPAGVFANLRGMHPRGALVADDILTDPANPLEPVNLLRVDEIFRRSLESLPADDVPLIVVGTPQSYEDTLYRLRENGEYYWARFPAELPDGRTLWAEQYDAARLRRAERRVGTRTYQVEYLLIPLLAVNSFLPRAAVQACVDDELEQIACDEFGFPTEPFDNPEGFPAYGGMDVGKEKHPTHISIGLKVPTGDVVQVYEHFVSGMDYATQARLVKALLRHFGVRRFYYDSTRGEMDDRNMPRRVIGRKFTVQLKAGLALKLESHVFAQEEEPHLILLPDPRQVGQIVAVNRVLASMETSEGHGDSFWSTALMLQAASDGPVMEDLGDAQGTFGGRGGFRRPAPAQ